MNTYPNHSFPQNWSSQDLADAVPLRLFELVTFEGGSDAACNTGVARGYRRCDYVRVAELPDLIRVR